MKLFLKRSSAWQTHGVSLVFKRSQHSLATAATRYLQVKDSEAGGGVPQGVYPGPKRGPLFQWRTGAFNKGVCIITVLWEVKGKYQGPRIYDVAFWKQSRSDARAVSQASEAIYRGKMEKQWRHPLKKKKKCGNRTFFTSRFLVQQVNWAPARKLWLVAIKMLFWFCHAWPIAFIFVIRHH